ncbi:MAG: glycosyltransferase [Candidatus Nezhaarchaeota archaeon]|nr:glycosyltransferase [Candidatus Nezhaarchaeota archaeon]
MLEPLALALALVHFGLPLAYYWYTKVRWFKRRWDITIDENYRPRVTTVIPTYNEAKHMVSKLNNIYEQEYPRELVEVVVVDSASTDRTPELVEKWAAEHQDIKVKIVHESCRRGMVPAINYALKTNEPSGEIVVLTDADAWWPTTALKNIVKYFADDKVGAVTASVTYEERDKANMEDIYRHYYNILRISESKRHSTPVHNGPLVAFRKNLLYKIGLLPEYVGNDDSTPASVIAFMGYRAIQVNHVVVKEYIRENQFWRIVRRAQHLVAHFVKTKGYVKNKNLYLYDRDFEVIWKIEWWLHVANPWCLLASLALFLTSYITSLSMASFAIMVVGVFLLGSKVFRTWVLQQICLAIAAIKNLRSVNIVWSK